MHTVSQDVSTFSKETKEYFKGLNLEFTLYPEKQTKSYKSLDHFYEYINKEVEFWNDCRDGKANQIRAHFYSVLNELNKISRMDYSQYEQSIKNSFQRVISDVNKKAYPCVYSVTSTAKFIRRQYNINTSYADAAIEYLLERRILQDLSNRDKFVGFLDAYLYENPNTAQSILKNEKESLIDLHLEYTNSLNTLDQQYYDKQEQLEKETTRYREELTSWKDDIVSSTEEFVEEKKKELEDLVNLYEEKLRLEAPAKYWEETENEYENIGKRWMKWAITISTCFVLLLTIIFFILPDFTGFNYDSVKMTVIFAIVVSVGIFVINFFVRLSTSAFHLSRDAKERKKLAYVYLALLKDKGVEESDRSIILQSLFSRADTGLLKGDSSPTLPDGLVGQVLKNVNTK